MSNPPNLQQPPQPTPQPPASGLDPRMLVEFTSTRTEFEGQSIANALESRGIPARVFAAAANMAQLEGGISNNVRVMVRRSDLTRARDAMRDVRQASVDLDWNEVDVGEPEPGTILPTKRPTRRIGGMKPWRFWVRRVGLGLLAATMAVAFVNPGLAVPVLIVAILMIVLGPGAPKEPVAS